MGFGGKSPICPTPPPKPSSGPITLDVLQGEWHAGNGSQITISGTLVYLNGLPLEQHKIELYEDGTVCGVGRLWQLDNWTDNGSIQFYAGSDRGEFDPKVVWMRKDAGDVGWAERMRLLGYAGTAADPLNRGVEGCIPGTLAQDMPSKEDVSEGVEILQTLLGQWREPVLQLVRSCHVVPDFTNRDGTSLGVEHVHYVANSFREHGFRKRQGTVGHDIPVVVREPPGSVSHQDALRAWKEKVAEEEGFPPVRIRSDEEMFTSLGNGHFFQALNLYACKCKEINAEGQYIVWPDPNFSEAISLGVPSIVLIHDTPRPVRAKIAKLLNTKREFLWTLGDDGNVDLSIKPKENQAYCKQFECMSKHLDAVQVNSLVRSHSRKGQNSKRIQG